VGKLSKGSRSPPRVSREDFAALESRHHTHNHHFGHYEATGFRPKRCELGIIAELTKDQKEKCDTEGNDSNAVYAGNADLDSENAKHDNMMPHNLATFFQVSIKPVSQIFLKSPFLQRRS
jgi:hypothetical protein